MDFTFNQQSGRSGNELDDTSTLLASHAHVTHPLELETFPIFERELRSNSEFAVPGDLEIAQGIFQANCGPASFAALVGALVTDIIRFFPHFPDSPHTTVPHMKRALDQCGVTYTPADAWPRLGLCLIQFTGPWTEKARYHAAAQHRHWVAAAAGKIYDVNANAWMPRLDWEREIMPLLVAGHIAATGWQLAKSYEVLPSLRYLPEFPLAGRTAS
jgi:hypothetical protein